MKKKHGQKDLVANMYPTLKNKEAEKKLAEIEELNESAKKHGELLREVKDTIKGFVLGLSEEDQEVGKLQCGGYILGFTITKSEEAEVSFIRKEGKRVRIKFENEEEKEESEEKE